jgi:hypothetical protein
METGGEPLAFYPKSLKLSQSIRSVPKSLGQQRLKKSDLWSSLRLFSRRHGQQHRHQNIAVLSQFQRGN